MNNFFVISKFKDVTHNYLNEIWNGKHLVLELQKLVVCWFMEKKIRKRL